MSADFAGQRVLVTGARGFLGSHLVRRLTSAGAELHCVSRTPPESTAGVRWWRGDLCDRGGVERLFADVQPAFVYHLGGHVTASPGLEHVGPTFETLLGTTVWILLASAQSQVKRTVLVGSASESTMSGADPTPASPYVASKWAASAYGRMFHALYQAPVVCVRPVMIFGPGQPREKLLPTVITTLLRGEAPRLSSGRLAADWVYVEDVIEGLFRAGYVAGAEGCTIDLGSGSLTSVRDMVGRIVSLIRERNGACPDPLFGAIPDRPYETYNPANTEFAFQKLGWRAGTALEDGLRRTVAWLSQQAT
jgi:UDP-glucose 4-epimerase